MVTNKKRQRPKCLKCMFADRQAKQEKKNDFFFFNLKLQLKTKSKCTKRPSKKRLN